jgi:hypothetical protein
VQQYVRFAAARKMAPAMQHYNPLIRLSNQQANRRIRIALGIVRLIKSLVNNDDAEGAARIRLPLGYIEPNGGAAFLPSPGYTILHLALTQLDQQDAGAPRSICVTPIILHESQILPDESESW